ncbi:hypothetical protein [Extibacter muris]|uniref:Uncharacterized protein n=1 Tax=Extibacter muris TaxID=1796622 RepID=A0A4R4FFI3_9FIRM|nr:hypothetical protein [Extibacter muris]MCU0080491.1 hypothetical protein [Extibacter muris]TDA21476.1 hypothetical protein E1963_10715 [Extibacter muris]
MSRILYKQDFIEMCHGTVLRSDGGDYPLQYAIEEIERIDRERPIEIEFVNVDEMEEGLYAVTAGKLGLYLQMQPYAMIPGMESSRFARCRS